MPYTLAQFNRVDRSGDTMEGDLDFDVKKAKFGVDIDMMQSGGNFFLTARHAALGNNLFILGKGVSKQAALWFNDGIGGSAPRFLFEREAPGNSKLSMYRDDGASWAMRNTAADGIDIVDGSTILTRMKDGSIDYSGMSAGAQIVSRNKRAMTILSGAVPVLVLANNAADDGFTDPIVYLNGHGTSTSMTLALTDSTTAINGGFIKWEGGANQKFIFGDDAGHNDIFNIRDGTLDMSGMTAGQQKMLFRGTQYGIFYEDTDGSSGTEIAFNIGVPDPVFPYRTLFGALTDTLGGFYGKPANVLTMGSPLNGAIDLPLTVVAFRTAAGDGNISLDGDDDKWQFQGIGGWTLGVDAASGILLKQGTESVKLNTNSIIFYDGESVPAIAGIAYQDYNLSGQDGQFIFRAEQSIVNGNRYGASIKPGALELFGNTLVGGFPITIFKGSAIGANFSSVLSLRNFSQAGDPVGMTESGTLRDVAISKDTTTGKYYLCVYIDGAVRKVEVS